MRGTDCGGWCGAFLLLALVALVVAPAGDAPAEPALAWDRDQVLELVERAELELEAAEAASRDAASQPTVLQQRSRDAAVQQIPEVRAALEALRQRLAAGDDRELTAPLFRNVRRAVIGLQDEAADAQADPTAGARWQKTRATVEEIGRYYGP